MSIKKLTASLLISSCFVASTAHAEIGFGVGATLVYGDKTGFDIGVGPKLFSTNEEEKVTASAGIDYLVKSSAFRPNIGVSYLFKEDAYADINVGYNLVAKGVDFGLGFGYTKTDEKVTPEKATPDANVPPPVNPTEPPIVNPPVNPTVPPLVNPPVDPLSLP